ncbi:hypothetical protein [Arthrobacter sp. FW306-04-A]|uniref:hypothetical protein n=1 Tax=Arthrobacter sp. FW306-04-A TaxID=2879619 RepID=UPI0037C016BB|nr:hypothetical protein LFT43_11170 [Arthrobacter sp. FW306-04-A]
MIHYSLAESWGALDQVDLVLHPTIHAGAHGEPYSLSAAQALISGVPIIASRSGNVPHLLEGYGPMLIVPLTMSGPSGRQSGSSPAVVPRSLASLRSSWPMS